MMERICRFCVFASLLLVCQLTYSANLSIQILQKGTGDPVDGAAVVLGQTELYEETDAQGMARFNGIIVPQEIKVIAPGFESSVIQISPASDFIKIFLVPLTFEGEGLQVVAERIADKVSKITLTADELAHSPGSQGDPIAALSALPGIVTTSSGQVHMRGSKVDDNITLVDRVPIGYLFHFFPNRSTINPRLISDLNIFLGGFPVEYGDKLGGVIDIKLRPPKKDRHHYSYSISTIESSFLDEGPIGSANSNDSYFLAGRRSYIDLLLSPEKFSEAFSGGDEDSNRFITVPWYYDIQALYHKDLNTGSVDAYYYSAHDKMAIENREGVKADPQLAGVFAADMTYHTLGFTWRQPLESRWNFDMPLAMFLQETKVQVGTDDNGDPFFANSKQKNLLWKPQFKFKRNDEEIKIGLDAEYLKIPVNVYAPLPNEPGDPEVPFTDRPKYRVNETITATVLGGYAKQRMQWTPKFTSVLGLRYSSVNATGGIGMRDFSPRLAAEYQWDDKMLLMASWGRYLQVPRGYQLINGFGNPSLEFTEAEHRIIGMKYQITDLWDATVELYQKPMKKLVVTVAGEPPNNYSNAGTGEAYGVDIFIKRKRKDGIQGWLSYSYAKSRRNKNDGDIGETVFSSEQPHTLTVLWSEPIANGPFDWMKNWKRWNWGFKFHVHSGRRYTPLKDTEEVGQDEPKRTVPVWGEVNSKQLPTFYQLDFRIDREILRDEMTWKVFLDILNITNHKNVTGYDYGENFDEKNEVTDMPIYPYFGVEAEF